MGVFSECFLIDRRAFAGILRALIATSPPLAQQRTLKIVSTATSITGVLFAIRLGDQAIGVSFYCDSPVAVQKLAKVGTYIKHDSEPIARLLHDSVILQRPSPACTARLSVLYISVLDVPPGALKYVFNNIQLIARQFQRVVGRRVAFERDPIKSPNDWSTEQSALPEQIAKARVALHSIVCSKLGGNRRTSTQNVGWEQGNYHAEV